MTIKKLLAGIAATCALLSFAAHAMTWDLPNAYPDNNFQTQNLRWFAKQVDNQTHGKLKLVVHSDASMFKMGQLKRAVRTDQVPIAEFILSAFGNENAMFEADSVPFLAVGRKQVAKLYRIQKPYLKKIFAKEGLVPLYSVPWPNNSLYTQTPVKSLADFKGMKMRGQTPMFARLVQLIGAVPVNIQFVEIPQAFETGVVSGMFTSAETGVNTQAWEYTKYFYDVGVARPRDEVVVNASAWKKLPDTVRQTVLKVAKEAEARGWRLSDQLQVSARKTLAEHGMHVIANPSAHLMAQFKKIGHKMAKEWVKRAGPDGAALVKRMDSE